MSEPEHTPLGLPDTVGEAADSANETKPLARQQKEPVVTLVGFLSGRTGASAFLKNLRDANVWSFSDSDREAAFSRHRELDPKFTKTTSLLAHALRAKDDRHALPVSDFARLALLERLRDYPHWI